MHPEARNRSACDRCHSQKLRCPKSPASVVCGRCLKAGALCTYSPPGTATAASSKASSGIGLGNGAVASMDMHDTSIIFEASEWPTAGILDFNLIDNADESVSDQFAVPPRCPADRLPSGSSSSPTENWPGGKADGSLSLTHRLTRVLAAADSLLERLPRETGFHIMRQNTDEVSLRKLGETMATKSLLEDFFILAQQLVDIYPQVTDAVLIQRPEEPCNKPDCVHSVELPPILSCLEEETTPRRIDMALFNVIFACHTRLLDTLDGMFKLMTSCVRVTIASRREPDFDVSELRIGSFVPEKTAAASMQIALLKHFLARVADRMASLGHAIDLFPQTAGDAVNSTHGHILKLQYELLMTRQSKIAPLVNTMEDFLLNYDFFSK